MTNSRFSRRNFITTVAAGATTVANFTPLQNFAGIISEEQAAFPDGQIKIISTENFSVNEQERITAVSKNIDLQIVPDSKSPALEEAEVIIGNVDSSILQRAKKLKWVQVLHAGVENMPKEMIAHPLVLTNMRVLATDAKPMHKPDFVEELHDPTWFMEMVPKVDVLMSALPLTKETKEMFNDQVFSKMKPDSYFINMTRGGLVKQDALIEALKSKKIRGAGLDVTTPEPLPADNLLWTCPNLVITGHNSTVAPIRNERVFGLVMENVRRYTLGLPLMNVVDKEKGY